MQYDLIIIGGGPAGYHAALKASEKGLKVALFEGKQVGGTCLNEGCIPTKALLQSSKVFEYAKNASRYGVSVSEFKLDHAQAVSRKDRIVKALVQSIADRLKKSGVLLISEKAVISGKQGELFQVKTESQAFEAPKLLISTGSVSSFPPIPGMDEAIDKEFAISSTQILALKEVPQKLLILGGGIIGLEMAQYFAAAGSSVKVVEMLDHIGGNLDPELSQILKRELEQKGIEFFLEARVTAVKEKGLEIQKDGQTLVLEADKVLVSTGRKPRVAGIGLESIGLDASVKRIETSETMETKIPGVFAAGDVNGKSMLAHTAYREAEVAVSNILGNKEIMNYSAIPSVLYTSPEVAWVGETEEELTKRSIAYECIKLPMMLSGRYAAEGGSVRGIIKTFREKGTDKLLGVHVLGNGSSEFIFGAAMIMENGLTMEQAGKTVFPHPTISEVLRECLNYE